MFFVTILGFSVDRVFTVLAYPGPVSSTPIMLSFILTVLILMFVAYMVNRSTQVTFNRIKLTSKEKAFLIIPLLFPALSIVGTRVMDLYDNNMLLMILLLLIPASIIFITIFRRHATENIYAGHILLTALSLVLILSLRSNHLVGSDVHEEYYIFSRTLENARWTTIGTVLDSCLVISIFPAVYQLFLNVDPEYLYKVLFPLLFSPFSLVVYVLAKKYVGSYNAFLAAFFCMSQVNIFWATGFTRNNAALFFFSSAIMVAFHGGIGNVSRRALFIIFALSTIVSHYSTTYVFFFVLLFTWIGIQIQRQIFTTMRGRPYISRFAGKNEVQSHGNVIEDEHSETRYFVNIDTVMLFLVMIFVWYSQITVVAFDSAVSLLHRTLTNIGQAFIIETKGPTVAIATTAHGISLVAQRIRFVVSWLAIILINTGILISLLNYRKAVRLPGSWRDKASFLRSKFEVDYFSLCLSCVILLVLTMVLPYILAAYSLERTFFQTLPVLSLFLAIGGFAVTRNRKILQSWIILAVLIPYFMCISGTMYQLFGERVSIVLNAERGENFWNVHDYDSYAAKWLSKHKMEGELVYSGRWPGPRTLMSQGKMPAHIARPQYVLELKQQGKDIDGYIYLKYWDTNIDRLVIEHPEIFWQKNKLYTNGRAEVYR
jgi:uncharacterized membrane protein